MILSFLAKWGPCAFVVLATGCGGTDATIDGGGADGSADGAADASGDQQLFDAPSPDDAADAQPPVDAGPCTYGDPNACPQGWYCDAPTCTTGTCVQKPAMDSPPRAPVCGCDDVTYWNASVAAVTGMSVKAQGECKTPKTCNEMGLKCATGAKCNLHLLNLGICAALNHLGSCWMMPKQCPQILIGPLFRACGANMCTAECDLITAEKAYASDNTCPQ